MPPSSLLVAVDMESVAALRIEPHLRTAAVYLNLYLFGADIHVDFEHFPSVLPTQELARKISCPSCRGVFATTVQKITRFYFAFGCWPRGTSAQRTNAKDGHLPARSEA